MIQFELLLIPKRVFSEETDCWQSYANSGMFDEFSIFQFLETETETLWDVFRAINEACDTEIAEGEDAEIPAGQVVRAIQMAKGFLGKKTEGIAQSALDKFLQALECAKESGKPVYFWF